MCHINPKVDFAFKKLFGSEENKDLLMSLINAIISEEEQIVQIKLKNPYNLANYRAGKMSIIDIKTCDQSGRWFNVEMQIGENYMTSLSYTMLNRKNSRKNIMKLLLVWIDGQLFCLKLINWTKTN